MIKIGILFGGVSREREISFAGGRTVYDSLDKSIFQPVPIFIDGKGNLILLNWQYVYKGTIRDFFPPDGYYFSDSQSFQIYSESLELSDEEEDRMIERVGRKVNPVELSQLIDFAFLTLHGAFGEDGMIQGLLDFYRIPYSGSGIFASAVGISKALQKKLMRNGGFNVNSFFSFTKREYDTNRNLVWNEIKNNLQFPVVVKSSSQGSSIGVQFLDTMDASAFHRIVEASFFRKTVELDEWRGFSEDEKYVFTRGICDLQSGLGLPLLLDGHLLHLPEEVKKALDCYNGASALLEAVMGETSVVVEEKITGKEFSCIVVRNENGNSIALPPTEIRKKKDLFDYRSKYLPGITRKVTPIELPEDQIEAIRTACVKLFEYFEFNVYARIDGFITAENEIFLNDPNTTSGMLPSSFFFHQAAEIGLSPTQFLTYIIHQSLLERSTTSILPANANMIFNKLENQIKDKSLHSEGKKRIGVIFGGYSSERHISVESGRNVFEKLSSSGKYETLPIFLTKNDNDEIEFYQVPVNLLLKDNADDIRDKINHFKINPVIERIITQAEAITAKFASEGYDFYPKKLEMSELPDQIDFAFMALHGRPGEDGTLQKSLESLNIPYNGSGPESSAMTIDKYVTNEILKNEGILVANHTMVWKEDWLKGEEQVIAQLEDEFPYPFIAKPADDGCSSAVRKIKCKEDLELFAKAIFRYETDVPQELAELLQLKTNEEFPIKKGFLVEELISSKGAKRFIEVTGGMLSYFDEKGNLAYEVFEASESVAEEGILSLEEKFLAGEGQNITPARYSSDKVDNQIISDQVKAVLARAAQALGVQGYCRIDAFVRIYDANHIDVIIIEINSLPGLTPATCIFHQAAINTYKPVEFLEKIIDFGIEKSKKHVG